MRDELEVVVRRLAQAPRRRPRGCARRAAPASSGEWVAQSTCAPPAARSWSVPTRATAPRTTARPRLVEAVEARGSRTGCASRLEEGLAVAHLVEARVTAGARAPRPGRCRSRASSRPAGRSPTRRRAGAALEPESTGATATPSRAWSCRRRTDAALGGQAERHRDRLDDRRLAAAVLPDQERHAGGQVEPVVSRCRRPGASRGQLVAVDAGRPPFGTTRRTDRRSRSAIGELLVVGVVEPGQPGGQPLDGDLELREGRRTPAVRSATQARVTSSSPRRFSSSSIPRSVKYTASAEGLLRAAPSAPRCAAECGPTDGDGRLRTRHPVERDAARAPESGSAPCAATDPCSPARPAPSGSPRGSGTSRARPSSSSTGAGRAARPGRSRWWACRPRASCARPSGPR